MADVGKFLQKLNIVGFVEHSVSVATTLLCHCSRKAAHTIYKCGSGWVPITLDLQNQVAGPILQPLVDGINPMVSVLETSAFAA